MPAHEAPDATAAVLRQALLNELAPLVGASVNDLLKRRERKIRNVRDVRGRLSLFVHHPGSRQTAPAK
jgi:acetyl-CoA carboxylase alpha subunit